MLQPVIHHQHVGAGGDRRARRRRTVGRHPGRCRRRQQKRLVADARHLVPAGIDPVHGAADRAAMAAGQ